ncbi:hypothetical protein [Lapidilactobacillus gannanensis]|uniref:Holin n=1 Tax=Lapidilactobacillus gannanensis TaxID=2486002 RepID=A0ABW4BP57_9LACO|nr:hypothetical protein [Lapidilactobacillus gannanensis]
MLDHLGNIIFGGAWSLMPFYLGVLLIRVIFISADYGSKKFGKTLLNFLLTEVINCCLMGMCAIIDQLLPYLNISWNWSVATFFGLIIIFEEMLWIISKSSKYVNVGFLRQTVSNLLQIVQQHTEK